MTDHITKQPLKVLTDEYAGPYIHVPGSQLAEVEKMLKAHGIRCWPDEHIISLNEEPAMGVINLGKNGNAAAAQALLDSVP